MGPCYVCLTAEQPNAILLDCKHGGLCYECAKVGARQGMNDLQTPRFLRIQLVVVCHLTDHVLTHSIPQSMILHGGQHCPVCREKIKLILRIPDEVLKLPGEGIGCHFLITEGIIVNSTGTVDVIRNNQFVQLFLV